MLKKIHFKRNKMKNTLSLHRLQGGVSALTLAAASRFKQLLIEYPQRSLVLMCLVLFTSLILCFTLLRSPKNSSSFASSKAQKPIAEMGGAVKAATALSQVLLLQSELNERLSAKHLSAQDSVQIGQMIFKIKTLQTHILSHEKDKP